MNVDLSKREMMLMSMALNNEVIDMDQRLKVMDPGADVYAGARRVRCELKVMASRFDRLKEAA